MALYLTELEKKKCVVSNNIIVYRSITYYIPANKN